MIEKTCKYCFGKGYTTELNGIRDLGDIKQGKTYSANSGKQIDAVITVNICSCDRGDDIKKYFNVKRKYQQHRIF